MSKLWRVLPFVFGWYLAMSYPLKDDPSSLLLSLGIGTLGVVIVAFHAYACGFWDAMPPKDKRPFGIRTEAAVQQQQAATAGPREQGVAG